MTLKHESIESRDENSVSLKKQVLLMGMGMQGLLEENKAAEVRGFQVTGTSRSFVSKCIRRVNDKEIKVKLPAFELIGRDTDSFRMVIQSAGRQRDQSGTRGSRVCQQSQLN